MTALAFGVLRVRIMARSVLRLGLMRSMRTFSITAAKTTALQAQTRSVCHHSREDDSPEAADDHPLEMDLTAVVLAW
jgi:hypothetical protein